MGVLPFFKGILHRDDYAPCRKYGLATHSLCCARLLRDLVYAAERDGQQAWAEPFIKLLLRIKQHVERSANGMAGPAWLGRYRKEYRELIDRGLKVNPPAVRKDAAERGRTAQTKTINLLLRVRDNEAEVLRFATHELAEFDNNLAERDLRMNKLRQKISGGFRSRQAGEEFMWIRSFILTAIKQHGDPVKELVNLFTPGNYEYMRFVSHPE